MLHKSLLVLILFFAILFIGNTHDDISGDDFFELHTPGKNYTTTSEKTSLQHNCNLYSDILNFTRYDDLNTKTDEYVSIEAPTPALNNIALGKGFQEEDSVSLQCDDKFPVVSVNTSTQNFISGDGTENNERIQVERKSYGTAEVNTRDDTFANRQKSTMSSKEQNVLLQTSAHTIPPSNLSEDYLVAYIPEKEWRIPGLEGRELTVEIAEKYPRGRFIKRSLINNSWGTGEHLVFAIKYSFYQAGTATMSVLEKKEVNGGLCYNIQTTARSNEFISTFYEVRDKVTTYIDVNGLFSRRFEKILREGNYKSDRVVDFYPDRLIALNTTNKHSLREIPLYVQDVLSALYYIRTINLEGGGSKFVEVYADGKVYLLRIIIHGKEKITVPAGTFECLKIEPILQSEGIFKQKGKLTIWLTDDTYKIPAKMESKVLIGSISSILESYSTGAM
ncbi:DUF3108 domain-containing protein [Candidatus Latescibacterota bacterium]